MSIELARMFVSTHNRQSLERDCNAPRLLTTQHLRCFMAGSKSTLTAARLRELLHYDPETGVFTRLTRSAWNVVRGSNAGTVTRQGYIQISVDGRSYLAHRLAILFVRGEFPECEVDHIDGVKSNNALLNIRCVDLFVNHQNIRSAHKDNKTGFLGVSFRKDVGKFSANIYSNSRNVPLGWFETPQEAHAAYVEAKRRLHAGCTI